MLSRSLPRYLFFIATLSKKETKIPDSLFLNVFTTVGETASSMYSAILNGIVGVHIDKRVAIGTRSANQNPEFRKICRGVQIEARPYEYSISFPGDLSRDTAHAQRQFPTCKEISVYNIEFGNKKRITIWNERAIHGLL